MDIKILVVDDEPYMAELIERLVLENTPYPASKVTRSEQVLPLLERDLFNLVFLDLRMPGMDGMQLLKEIKRRHPQTDVVMVTGYGTVETAVEALQHGASDFVTKPFANQELMAVLDRVLKLQDLTRQNRALRGALAKKYSLDNLIGHGPIMMEIKRDAAEAANSGSPAAILGEFGTGKSFLARALHFSGPRASGPFLSLDLASINPLEMEALIFGRRDAAGNTSQGNLAAADGGTLHLGGIDLMPSTLQNRLAGWLEQGRFLPAESQHLESADARLIVSSETELDELAAQGRLERALAMSAGKIILRLPPLRARREDIILVAGRILQRLGAEHGKENLRLSDSAIKWLLANDWPGNLRELENTLERAVLLCNRELIEEENLAQPDALNTHLFSIDSLSLDQPFSDALEAAKAKFMRDFETAYLRHHLQKSRGDLEALTEDTALPSEKLNDMIARTNLSLKRYRKGL